jgi:hypothetical protein
MIEELGFVVADVLQRVIDLKPTIAEVLPWVPDHEGAGFWIIASLWLGGFGALVVWSGAKGVELLRVTLASRRVQDTV